MKLIKCTAKISELLAQPSALDFVQKLKEKSLYDPKYSTYYPYIEMISKGYALSLLRAEKISELSLKPFLVGMLGPQGSGKTSLSRHMCQILQSLYSIQAKSISIDDFYLSYKERMDRNLTFRGPPGTHDLPLLTNFFEAVNDPSRSHIDIPVFDKGMHDGQGDRTAVLTIAKPEVIVFEGWFVGLRAIKGIASEANSNLSLYEKFWDSFNVLTIVLPQDFSFSYAWRAHAEKENKSGQMSEEKIKEFVSHFLACLDPHQYYNHIIDNAGSRASATIRLDIDIDHKVTSMSVL